MCVKWVVGVVGAEWKEEEKNDQVLLEKVN